MARRGRPMKYDGLIRLLEDDRIYIPATIIQNADQLGWFARFEDPEERVLVKERARHSLSRFSVNHAFPKDGDGLARIDGQAPIRGWYGWRWKETAFRDAPEESWRSRE